MLSSASERIPYAIKTDNGKLKQKCQDVCEFMEIEERNTYAPLPYPAFLWILSDCKRKPIYKRTLPIRHSSINGTTAVHWLKN